MGFFGPPNIEKMKAKNDVKGLVKALGYQKDEDVRKAAAEALSRIGAPAVEPLTSALKDKDADVCSAAARALGRIGDPRAVEPLTTALGSKSKRVREAVAEALGEIGDPRAVVPLIATLMRYPIGRGAAAKEALDRLGWDKAISFGPMAVEPLIHVLEHSDVHVCEAALDVLVKIGQPAVEPLTAALKNEASKVRRNAALALGEIGDPRAVNPLIATLEDKHSDVYMAGVEAMVKIDATRAVEPLIAALRYEPDGMRWCAAEALGEIGDPRAVEPLIAALRDTDWHVRQAAAKALDKLGWGWDKVVSFGAVAVQPLIDALKDARKAENHSEYEAIAMALRKIHDASALEPLVAGLWNDDPGVRQAVAAALSEIGKPAIERFVAVLQDKHSPLIQRTGAAEALGEIGDPRAIEPLIAVLKEEPEKEIIQTGPGYVITQVNPRISEPYKCLRQVAAKALGKIGDLRAVEPLIGVLRDRHWFDEEARGDLVWALGEIGDIRAVGPLIAALKDTKQFVRKPAAEALVKMYHKEPLDEQAKRRILDAREIIISPHSDGMSSACMREHGDEGIGVDFPL